MKNTQQITEAKLLKKFDMDLRNILMADLKVLKSKSQFVNKQLVAAA
ncbi:hypothetical protein [Mucilaginibacter terrae]|uniref:50S ribosomal protein L29 n=1 Tax=Mucilaginibacter terrae TaxID=1955052 RepID=A0ABU3GVL2_9SPHI|nr:hypothetical protein [Mucilaginibacter terrae]MDT3402997.1 hypothetical protein [Mucilaginibacter terrae]